MRMPAASCARILSASVARYVILHYFASHAACPHLYMMNLEDVPWVYRPCRNQLELGRLRIIVSIISTKG